MKENGNRVYEDFTSSKTISKKREMNKYDRMVL